MTTEGKGNIPETPGAGDASPAVETPSCAPDCGCGKPAGGSRTLKIAVCIAAVVAVCGILAYKAASARFGGRVGTSLPSVTSLDTLAADQSSVFLIVPGKDGAPPAREAYAELESAVKSLQARGIRTGIYTLQVGAPEYPDMAARVSAPGIAVLTKGRGIGVVARPVSESSLVQAYVASTQTNECGPDCKDPASGPCK